jgi:hypothetical protein
LHGGTESPYHHWKDALQLAAHEMGARPASDQPPGVHVVTSAGKEYLETMLRSFQQDHQLEGVDQVTARKAILVLIKGRMYEIYEQLVRWPQVPFT